MSQKQDITIDQGSDYTFLGVINYTIPDGCVGNACSTIPYDLTNKGVRAQIRKTYDACDATSFTTSITDATNGKFKLYLGATVTELMAVGTYVWDVEIYDLTDSDQVIRPFYGAVTVTAEVTKA